MFIFKGKREQPSAVCFKCDINMTGKKNHEIRVKLSLDEKKEIERKAKELGLSRGGYLRLLGLSSELPTNFH